MTDHLPGRVEPSQGKEVPERVAALQYDPDLNDGGVLTIAPLDAGVPWKEARRRREEFCAGEDTWSTICQRLRAKSSYRWCNARRAEPPLGRETASGGIPQ